MTEARAANLPYHPFDLTKVWYHEDAPLIEVGVLKLNRNPKNYSINRTCAVVALHGGNRSILYTR